MDTRLFKEPYQDAGRPDLFRLLFEACKGSPDPEEEEFGDFYLYIWIREKKHLHAFQAVLDDEYILTYQAPDKLTFGSIGNAPISRAIKDNRSAPKRRKMTRLMARIGNEHFPALLRKTGAIAQGEYAGDVVLEGDERKIFEKLLKSRRR